MIKLTGTKIIPIRTIEIVTFLNLELRNIFVSIEFLFIFPQLEQNESFTLTIVPHLEHSNFAKFMLVSKNNHPKN
jgi:hypothetical protein